MGKRRTTFGKLQRERDKQAKQIAKRERRTTRDEEQQDAVDTPAAPVDEQAVLAALAALHAAYGDGRIGLDDFEAQRDELRERLQQAG